MRFPSVLDTLAHGQYVKDFRSGAVGWTLENADHTVDGTKLSDTSEARINNSPDGLLVRLNRPLDFAACNQTARALRAGSTYEHDPTLNGVFSDGVSFSGTLPFVVPTEGAELFNTRIRGCRLESTTHGKIGRKAFTYLTEFTGDKWRNFHGKSAGIEFFTVQADGESPFFHLHLDEESPISVEDAFDAYIFALSFFYGTRIKWYCRSLQQCTSEYTEFRPAQPEKAVKFETPVNWRDWPRDQKDIGMLSDDDAIFALQQFADYYLKHGYSAVVCLLEYCWELSIDAQIYSRILAIAVAIEGISNDVLESKMAPNDPVYEELVGKIQVDLIAAWVKDAPDDATKKLRNNAKNRFTNAVSRRNELSGRMLVKAAFDSVGATCTEAETKLWSAARNKAAHPNLKERDSNDEVLKNYFSLIDMLYRLVLAHMNYKGERIDYSTAGQPTVRML